VTDHERDWRVTEGPVFGIEPEFELTAIRSGANFFVTGSMSRRITADLTTSTPTLVESAGVALPRLTGSLAVYDEHPERCVLLPRKGPPTPLGNHRGILGMITPDRYLVILYLPPDQFARLLPLLCPASPRAMLRIEVDRTLDQGLLDSQSHFWDDRASPVILFNEFEITLPDAHGS
jgi:hypothetical protein